MSAPSLGRPVQEAWRINLEDHPDPELFGARKAPWWTGRQPSDCPGFDAVGGGELRALPMPLLGELDVQAVRDYFDNSWALTELLFAGLQGPEAFYRPPYHSLRHPLIFYYGHPAVFYLNKLRVAGLCDEPIQPEFEQLFEVGVDEMSWDDLAKNDGRWPSVREVTAYRRRVYELVQQTITKLFEEEGLTSVGWDDPAWALFMGMEHERIHIETSSVLVRELPLSLLQRPAHWPAAHPSAAAESTRQPQAGADYPENPLVAIAGGEQRLGKPRAYPSFGWDNEYGERQVSVGDFEASRQLVSNGEFYEFVKDGGYRNRELWTEEGWRWREHGNRKWPCFWNPDGAEGLHHYRLRSCFSEHAMAWSWPVVVNDFEARAFCAWKSEGSDHCFRLLTEAEHWRLRSDRCRNEEGPGADLIHRDGGAAMRGSGVNLGLAWGSESPVDGGELSEAGVYDARGNLWVWCEDHQHFLPGAEVHPLYDDFTSPCCQGEHQLIHGGSFVSTGDEASIWARYQFRPHFFQHAGFRLVSSPNEPLGRPWLVASKASSQSYEDAKIVNEYLYMHYGEPARMMPWSEDLQGYAEYPKRLVELLMRIAKEQGLKETRRALDLGCAVGAASFEFARNSEEVVGIDLSKAFIAACKDLQSTGRANYDVAIQGDRRESIELHLDPSIDRSRVAFSRGDACALPAELENFDLVLLANLLCRVPSPRAVLDRLQGARGLVAPGGLVCLASPYSWMAPYTVKSAWLGGQSIKGQEQRSEEVMRGIMEKDFDCRFEGTVPLVIPEHQRKFQLIFPHVTVWQRHA